MIGNRILYERDSVEGFKVRKIGNDSVKLEWESRGDEMHFGDQTESVEVVLKLSDQETALLSVQETKKSSDLNKSDRERDLPPVQKSKLSSDSNKWAGFRNLTWGTNIRDMNDPNMVLEEEDKGLAFYKRVDDKLSIGDAEIVAVQEGRGAFQIPEIYAPFGVVPDIVVLDGGEGRFCRGDRRWRGAGY